MEIDGKRLASLEEAVGAYGLDGDNVVTASGSSIASEALTVAFDPNATDEQLDDQLSHVFLTLDEEDKTSFIEALLTITGVSKIGQVN